MNGSAPAIECRALVKRFGDVVAVDGLSFTVPMGEVTGFVGGNGSGKTTTMRTLLGLTVPTSGSTLVAGRPMHEHPDPRRVVGAVVDRLGAHPGLTARRYLSLLVRATDLPADRVEPQLRMVGLDDAADRRIRTYSTGMRQRLALAAALIGDPRILVLDEPSSGLDPQGIRWMRGLLRERADAGTAVFVSTHQLAELASVVDRVVAIDRGRLIAAGPVDEVLSATGTATIEDLLVAGGAS